MDSYTVISDVHSKSRVSGKTNMEECPTKMIDLKGGCFTQEEESPK